MNRFIICTLILPLLLLGAGRGSLTTTQDHQLTRLDKLAHYIRYAVSKDQQSSCTPKQHDESYHIASALLTEGGSNTLPLIAIAQVESTFNPRAIGDGGSSLYMFQIQPAHWGKVHSNVYLQTRKAHQIFTSLRKNLLLPNATARWNGSGAASYRYSNRVLVVISNLKRGLLPNDKNKNIRTS